MTDLVYGHSVVMDDTATVSLSHLISLRIRAGQCIECGVRGAGRQLEDDGPVMCAGCIERLGNARVRTAAAGVYVGRRVDTWQRTKRS